MRPAPAARAAVSDPANAGWLRCGGTWFAGVDVLANDARRFWWLAYAIAQGAYLADGGWYIKGGSGELVARLVAQIRAAGGEALTLRANVGDPEHLHRMFEELQAQWGERLDILISNAASGVIKPAMELTERHWDWTMGINAATLLHLAKHAAPLILWDAPAEPGGRGEDAETPGGEGGKRPPLRAAE